MTKYKILAGITDDSGKPGGSGWYEAGEAEGANPQSAIRSYLDTNGTVEESLRGGMFVAVPARSWQPVKVAVETALKFS